MGHVPLREVGGARVILNRKMKRPCSWALPGLSGRAERLRMSKETVVSSARWPRAESHRVFAMLRNHHRNLSMAGLTVVLLLLGSVLDRGPSAYGANEPPQPAQKDSPTRAKPKDVVLTTSIRPAEARPGDTVTLKVTAKLNPGWHIYTQAKNQVGEGPRKTVLDLFDTAGLEVAGDWKADRKPESRAEPAFDNQDLRVLRG